MKELSKPSEADEKIWIQKGSFGYFVVKGADSNPEWSNRPFLVSLNAHREIESLKAEIAKRDELFRESKMYIYGDDSDSFEVFISKFNAILKESEG